MVSRVLVWGTFALAVVVNIPKLFEITILWDEYSEEYYALYIPIGECACLIASIYYLVYHAHDVSICLQGDYLKNSTNLDAELFNSIYIITYDCIMSVIPVVLIITFSTMAMFSYAKAKKARRSLSAVTVPPSCAGTSAKKVNFLLFTVVSVFLVGFTQALHISFGYASVQS